MVCRLLLSLVLAGCSVASVCAQQNDPYAESQLTVQVTYDNDHKAPENLRVELLSTSGSIVAVRVTDGFSPIVFLNLKPADYRIRVTGTGIIPTVSGLILVLGANRTEYVRVKRESLSRIEGARR